MKLSLIAAVAENRIIGSGLDIPWHAKGEQLIFKALTFNQWLLIGRKTFDSMGKLPDRKYAVVSHTESHSDDPDVLFFTSTDDAIENSSTSGIGSRNKIQSCTGTQQRLYMCASTLRLGRGSLACRNRKYLPPSR